MEKRNPKELWSRIMFLERVVLALIDKLDVDSESNQLYYQEDPETLRDLRLDVIQQLSPRVGGYERAKENLLRAIFGEEPL